jgi:O-antigen/teichoic acid export membrane protein
MRAAVIQVLSFDVLSKAMLATTMLLIIRYLPDSEYASYTLAMSLVGVLATTISSVFNRIYIVGHHETGEQGMAETFFGAQCMCWLALFVLTLPLAPWFGGLQLFIGLLILATCLSDFAKTFYQRELAFWRLSVVELLRTSLFLVATGVLILFVPRDLDAWHILLVQAVTMLAIVLAVFSGQLHYRRIFAFGRIRQLLIDLGVRDYKYVIGYFILVAVLSNLTIFLLKLLTDDYQLATFGSAMRYYNLLSLALGAVHVVLLPAIQKLQSSEELEHVLAQHRRLVLPFAALVLVAGVASYWGIPLVDRGKYPNAIPVFQILAASAVVSFAFSPYINVLLKMGDFKFIFWLMAIGLIANLAVSSVLIADYGVIGAAWGFALGMSAINVIVYRRASAYRLQPALTA